ncbi:MAG: tRNA-splicing endonuclease [Methanothrix sp.]|jgi:tRNA-intron endonuclease|nr:MAG: tRNA-splicing endonuclease [Methanothrix sp.]
MSDDPIRGGLSGDKVLLGGEATEELYGQGSFGRPVDGGLQLSLVEAAYLLDRSRIAVRLEGVDLDFRSFFEKATAIEAGFEFRYVVYKDLRERGYYVQPGVTDFRVYPRGGKPGKTPAEFYVRVFSERQPVPLKDLVEPMKVTRQMRKRLMLAVVDEESDITFYEARERELKGDMKVEVGGGTATLLEDRVMLWDPESSERIHEGGFYGKPGGGRLQLSLVESAYLLEKGLLGIVDRSGEPLSLEEFVRRSRSVEDDFDMKHRVYRDLREKDLVVKTGFKFGSHFRVYKRVESSRKVPHSEYLVHSIPEDHVFHLPVVSRAVRLAHSVRKVMVFARDEGGMVKYLEIGRLKP